MTSVTPALVVNQKPQRRFSTKGEINKELLCLSRGYPAHKLFGQKDPHMDRRLQSSLQSASTDTQHPHHHLVTYETVDNPSSNGLLKSTTAAELSHHDASMVRPAHDHCHTRAISREWITPDTYGHLHPQHARILFQVCPMMHIGCT